jgi:hypothetical protein
MANQFNKSNLGHINYFTMKLLVSSFKNMRRPMDRMCGLAASVPGYRPRYPGVDSRRYHIFCVAVGLERGTLSLVNTNEEPLERKSSGSGIKKTRLTVMENRRADHATPLYPQKSALEFADQWRSFSRYRFHAD